MRTKKYLSLFVMCLFVLFITSTSFADLEITSITGYATDTLESDLYEIDVWGNVYYSDNTTDDVYIDNCSVWASNVGDTVEVTEYAHSIYEGGEPASFDEEVILWDDDVVKPGETANYRWYHNKTFNKDDYLYIKLLVGPRFIDGDDTIGGSRCGVEVFFEENSIWDITVE